MSSRSHLGKTIKASQVRIPYADMHPQQPCTANSEPQPCTKDPQYEELTIPGVICRLKNLTEISGRNLDRLRDVTDTLRGGGCPGGVGKNELDPVSEIETIHALLDDLQDNNAFIERQIDRLSEVIVY